MQQIKENNTPDVDGLQQMPPTVLLTRFSALGDVAMTLPEIYNACNANPGVHFLMLTRSHPAKLFINPPKNLTVSGVNLDEYRGLTGLYRLFKQLQKDYRITTYVDFHDVLRTKILRALFQAFRPAGPGGKVRVTAIDKGRKARRRLTRRHNKHLLPLRPMTLRYKDALQKAGISCEPPGGKKFQSIFPVLPNPGMFSMATPPKEEGEKFIAIAPFAKHEGKIYPSRRMQEVIDILADNPGLPKAKIFIFGFGDKESGQIEKWRRGRGNIVNMAQKNIGLAAELALMAHCDLMLTMDSANMHLARLAGLRAISIWGATHPYCGFLPEETRQEDVLQVEMTCRPCSVFGNRKCMRGDYHCLKAITPGRIADAVCAAINREISEPKTD